jgi:hypothetical protein
LDHPDYRCRGDPRSDRRCAGLGCHDARHFPNRTLGSDEGAPGEDFPHINDFHNWLPWSPWEKLDPNLRRSYSGSADGRGAVYEWEGNKQVGKGRMEIMEALPPSKITIKLDFLKPFEAHHTSEFLLSPVGDSTNVTWTLLGSLPFIFKMMCVVFRFNMDKMVGKDYETGLANLKSIVEK